MNQQQNQPTPLNQEEQKAINGGSFLSDGTSGITIETGISLDISYTNRRGETESYNASAGTGTQLQENND